MNGSWKLHEPEFEFDRLSPLFRSESAWRGHMKFGYDLIAYRRPTVVVELGTHYGASFFSLCQAAKDMRLPDARLYAVDTWQGDAHAGRYGESVFELVRRAAALYPHAELVRSSFDEAAGQFADDSIDILHIDGLHTYEAVRHDCETWLPKLAPGGLLLLHDTEVRLGDFGVWKWWEELAATCPSASFGHSAGLGIAAPKGSHPAIDLLRGRLAELRHHYGRPGPA
ncbi:class I SAM-dependent methyltransferase [Paenibacillus albicereus]|uniref:Class I SAM-dependent methyltransferase n=1 Tax=Paenibacillus albicereus TaxID=2726185 RepID=A0A6H2GTZ8_9BACL|nr:class I SAM-dependent methyltransferase [Paenibacillus albicereus]QJC50862.1 class I SAM-dependent methyltransferase [Paenibacillus albicereus]